MFWLVFDVDIPNDNLILSRDINEREGMWLLSCMDILLTGGLVSHLVFMHLAGHFQKCDYVEIKLVASFNG